MTETTRLAGALADRYRIERELGQGGMATVYLAHDVRHDRRVALKVLRPELAAILGAERFLAEIKTTANLQHPHILSLFDSGEADGLVFYVMPYVEGESLRDRLLREQQLPVEDAVRIACDIADALDYAHRHGVIHRDIKPENILLHDGRAQVADFGIALAVSTAGAGTRMTETGMSLGTPHYMSPEQAMGQREISARSDVYALGCVLYEMLSGEPPFTGHNAQAIIARVMTEEPRSLTMQRKSIPPHVEAAVTAALEKLPADRIATASQFAEALRRPGALPRTTSYTAAAPAATRRSRVAMLAASSLAILAVVAAVLGWTRRSPEPPLRRFDLSFGSVTPTPGSEVVVSPDGSMLAMTGRSAGEDAIYLRHLGGDPEFRKLAGTETGQWPAFSPDNQWIVFRRSSDRSLVKISVGGGGAVTVLPAGALDPFFPQWGTSKQIVFVTVSGAFRVPAAGGAPVRMGDVSGRNIFPLPDGRGVLHTIAGQVALYDIASDSSVVLIPGGSRPVYVPTGHILYHSSTDGGLFAVPFDLGRRRVMGTPVRVLERVGAQLSSRGYSVSATGVLVQYDASTSLGIGAANRLVIVDPTRGADTVRMPVGRRNYPRFSRDGRFLAMEGFTEGRNGQTDIYTLDLVTGTYSQLTFEGDNDEPAWSPDGRQLLFDRVATSPAGEDLFIKPADNSGPERRLTTLGSNEVKAQQWIDDRTLLFDAIVPGRATDLFTVAAESGSAPVPYLRSPFDEREPQLSPDRRLLAFGSNETGSYAIWLRDFPVPQGKWNVSRGEGRAPRWSPDGRFLYFWRGGQPLDTLFRARVDRMPSVVVQTPEIVVVMNADGIQNWDLHPDGRRFVVAVPADEAAEAGAGASRSRYLILENWFGELRRLTAAPR